MTFHSGQLVVCIDSGTSVKIVEGIIYRVKHHSFDDLVELYDVPHLWYASRFKAVDDSPQPIAKPKLVLNEKAKKEKTTTVSSIPPNGGISFKPTQYQAMPMLFASSPLWCRIESHIPHGIIRAYVYDKLKAVYSSPSTTHLKPEKSTLLEAFNWGSTGETEPVWYLIYDALNTNNWSQVNAYIESHS